MYRENDDLLILPDEELRELYKSTKRKQRFLSLSLLVSGALLVLGISDLITSIVGVGHFSSSVADTVFAFAMAAAFVGMSAVFSENTHKQAVLAAVSLTVQVLLYPALLIMDAKDGTHDKVIGMMQQAGLPVGVDQLAIQLAMIVITALVTAFGRPIIRDLEQLKAHPRFPFNNVLKDESVIHRTDSEGVLRIIEHSLSGGKVTQVGGEELLEGEVKAYEKPSPDPAENLQQYRKIYRPREKAETAYTMDNLKNMYIDDGLENGELSLDELEKLLWAETRPKKPKEPEPEDFFQQSPIIYRTNKDGSSKLEHRDPNEGGSHPDEK